MINKETGEDTNTPDTNKDAGYIDVAHLDVQCHLLIKDKDTGEVLVNRRG